MLDKIQTWKLDEILSKRGEKPFFVYSKNLLNENISLIKETWAEVGGRDSKCYYSVKANPNKKLIQVIEKEMDGFDVSSFKELEKPNQKTIIVSGFSYTDRVKGAQKLGAGLYLRKPYTKEELGVAIRKELDKE